MKKILLSFLAIIFCCSSMFVFTACGIEENEGGDTDTTRLYISDYTLPENFAITMRLSDTSIYNPGDPWYFRTAKIGNDWQIIEYDRNVAYSQQVTHFFKYVSTDNYDHYIYNYETSSWIKDDSVTFDAMIETSLNNFLFLNKWERLSTINITETNIIYDVDSTSNEILIDAILYEFTNVLDYEEKVDAEYTDICLSHRSIDGSRVCYEFNAYDYSKSINDWSMIYLTSKNYKSSPVA